MRLAVLLLASCAPAMGLHLGAISAPRAHSRASAPSMKGKGTRGMPGKALKGPAGSSASVKKRLQKEDFLKRKEWVQVLDSITELGEEMGSSKAVQAGVTPTGQEFIWCLLRGKQVKDEEEPQLFAVDGACRCCQFPLLNAQMDNDASKLTCGLCGTSWSLANGECIDFLPATNPWAAKKANEAKGPQRLGILPTRVTKAGKVYLRLPDGTLLNKLP
ncbi:hypothetical protein AB1Y20_017551 [Prymnesium parvum]|uniref:Rieske domain-containing protein n=1 Tax=Prymnesium parvum TaxID=97485 RepID=A0AB34JMI4_PRYPA